MTQSLIGGTLQDAAHQAIVDRILAEETFPSRRAFGRRICREFPFVDGEWATAACGLHECSCRP
ncbi:MAG: hypothetical protein OXE85_04705 [Roseovarius sp.]|nr:hypothetical protein [Roseovarius sp.]